MKKINILFLLCCLAIITGCIYPYEPKGMQEWENLLVVEGDIIANGTTVVKLSRSTKLSADNTVSAESRAIVQVESSDGTVYPATEVSVGIYEAITSHLDPNVDYRLYIKTSEGKEYVSDYVPVCVSPPIDSVAYSVNADSSALKVHITTHDPSNKTRYYSWLYEENWEVRAEHYSVFIYDRASERYVDRPRAENIYYCWNKRQSSSILDKTTKLSEDIIYHRNLVSIGANDDRVSVLYCVQVSQKALTEEAYTYWENLLKNSEEMGGIFPTLPTEISGNIHAVHDSKEPVLGYINATTLTISDRLFIGRNVLKRPSQWWLACADTTIGLGARNEANILFDMGYVPLLEAPLGMTIGMSWAPAECVDCRLFGTKDRPDWWPNSGI